MKKENKKKTKKKIRIDDIYVIAVLVLVIVVLVLILANTSKCPIGYKSIDGVCATIDKTSPTVTKYCPDDYKLEKDKCIKTLTDTPKVTYYCDETHIKDKSVEMSSSSLSGTTCSYTLTHDPVKKQSCPDGSVPYNDTQCNCYSNH